MTDFCQLHCVMSGCEVDEDGVLNLDKFEEYMAIPAMRARFAVLGLDIWDSKRFFDMLTIIGGSKGLDLRSFVAGCMQLRGGSHRIGIQSLAAQVDYLTKLVKRTLPAAQQRQALSEETTTPVIYEESAQHPKV